MSSSDLWSPITQYIHRQQLHLLQAKCHRAKPCPIMGHLWLAGTEMTDKLLVSSQLVVSSTCLSSVGLQALALTQAVSPLSLQTSAIQQCLMCVSTAEVVWWALQRPFEYPGSPLVMAITCGPYPCHGMGWAGQAWIHSVQASACRAGGPPSWRHQSPCGGAGAALSHQAPRRALAACFKGKARP